MTGEPVELNEGIEDELDAMIDPHTQFSNDAEPVDEERAVALTTITALVRKGEN